MCSETPPLNIKRWGRRGKIKPEANQLKVKQKKKTFIHLRDSCQVEIAMLKGIFPLTEDNCNPPLTNMGIYSQHLTQDWCPTNNPPSRLYKNVTRNLHKDDFEDADYATLK